MSKRTDTIRSLFAAQAEPLSADNIAAAPRVSSGSVKSLRDSFSNFERENEELRGKIAAGAVVLDIDAALIDPSPVADRFSDGDEASFATLKASIQQRGQEVPILVREHPTIHGRYQSAYGHRRVRVALELNQPVKAILRELSDEDLVVAQGVENSARQDLSFIERAVFAMRLEDVGHERSVIQEALSIDRAEASKLLSVARATPAKIIAAIGRAPKVGRGRWLALAETLRDAGASKRAYAAVTRQGFADNDSDTRFLIVFAAAAKKAEADTAEAQTMVSQSGELIARLRLSDRELKVIVDRTKHPGFAQFLAEQLPTLFASYERDAPPKDRGA